jgi:anti-sigma regulatory factor (Ser/Thr protein kinase)
VTARNSISLPREPQSVRAARNELFELSDQLPPERLHDASLCLSELVTNAIQHPGVGGELQLTVAMEDARLRVEVADEGRGFDPGPPTQGDERGWGLFIVDNLSDDWGVAHGERTVVWFEITGSNAGTEAATRRRQSGEGNGESRQDRLLRAAALRLRGRLASP